MADFFSLQPRVELWIQPQVQPKMQVALAVEEHLVMQVELAVPAQLAAEPQEQAQRAVPSAGGTQSRQSANGRPDAR